jgi:hypothetical protein
VGICPLGIWDFVFQTLHRFIPDPSAPPSAPTTDPAQLAAVKTLVRQLPGLPAGTPVTLSGIARADPGCALLETVIAVFPAGRPALRWKLTRPRAALTKLMLRQTLATPPATFAADLELDAPVNLAP